MGDEKERTHMAMVFAAVDEEAKQQQEQAKTVYDIVMAAFNECKSNHDIPFTIVGGQTLSMLCDIMEMSYGKEQMIEWVVSELDRRPGIDISIDTKEIIKKGEENGGA